MGEDQGKEYLEPVDAAFLTRLHTAAGSGPVLILTHDNPDPDALASGKSLARLLDSAWGIPADLRFSGLVARAENKAMLSLLTPEWQPVEILPDQSRYSAVALVDTQPGAGNNSLPVEVVPRIVIDHHLPMRESLAKVSFVDVRPNVGATVSLIYQYLEAAGIIPDPILATAIFYGIQADTRSLSRGDSAIDRFMYRKLLDLIDRQLLARVEQACLPRDYFRAFSNGLQAARIYGNVAIAYQGAIHRPDFVAEMADLLVRLDGLRAVLCLGYHGDMMYLSLRTMFSEDDAGSLIQQMVIPPGKAGGHGMGAGGQIPLLGREPESVAARVEALFLRVLGEKGEGEPLLI
jgi:nanoRNase/pAp phosphatase (c-di-AMP/oligoRNAs hydrolase)